MSQPLLARIGAVRLLLQDMSGSPRHESVSQLQANALEAPVAREQAGLSDDQKANAAALISQMNWYGHHGLNVLQALAPSGPMAPTRKRAKGQSFLTLMIHITTAGWGRLLEEGVPPSAVQNMLVLRIIRLGGVHADENSLKLANSLWMLITMPDRVESLSYYDKKYFDDFKTAYHRVADKSPLPSAYMRELPQTPQDLLASFPTVYHAAFSAQPGDGPAACPLDMRILRDVNASYRCRGGVAPLTSDAASQELATRAPSNQMEQYMQQSMQQMTQMTQMMQMAFGAVAEHMRGGHSAAPTGDGDLLSNLTMFGTNRRPGRHPALAQTGAGASAASVSHPQAAAPTAESQHAGPPNVSSLAEESAPPTQSQPIAASAAASPIQSQPIVASAAASEPPAAQPAVEPARTTKMDIKAQVEEAMNMMLEKKKMAKGRGRGMKRPAACPAAEAADECEQENGDGDQEEEEEGQPWPPKAR